MWTVEGKKNIKLLILYMNGLYYTHKHSYKQWQKLLFAHYSKFNYNTVSVLVFLRIITINIYGFTWLDSKYIHNNISIHNHIPVQLLPSNWIQN